MMNWFKKHRVYGWELAIALIFAFTMFLVLRYLANGIGYGCNWEFVTMAPKTLNVTWALCR